MQSMSIHRRRVFIPASIMHPEVTLDGRVIYCNGIGLSIGRKYVASKIIKAFINRSDHRLNKLDLIEAITNLSGHPVENLELAFIWSRSQAVNRLISRLRCEFCQAFQSVVPAGFHWFHYDAEADVWLLYKLPAEGSDRKLYA